MKIEAFLLPLPLILPGSSLGQRPFQTAQEIVNKMVAHYSSVKTYEDAGSGSVVKDINSFKGMQWEEVLLVPTFAKQKEVAFRSYFQRPGQVRFEWVDNKTSFHRYSVIWANGTAAFSWRPSHDGNVFIWEKEPSLKWAIDEETRGSMGVFDILYNGLIGSGEYYSFSKMTRARIAREESIAGRPCYVILGYINDDPWALWIDKERFVLIRYRMQIATGSFDESVRTGYMPVTLGEVELEYVRTNMKIAPATFRFRPKLLKGDMDISKYKKQRRVAPPPSPQPVNPK